MPPAFEFRGGKDGGSRPPHQFTFRSHHPRTSARPLLVSKRQATPEPVDGPKDGKQESRKFLAVDEITDSDEADMDVSSAEGDGSQPPRKKPSLGSRTDTAANAPKWSNPDPYTVLPPPDESQTKKRDVVKLIRKARIQSTQIRSEEQNAVASNDDFISFDFDDQELDLVPANAPRGPRNLHARDGDPSLGNRKRTYDDKIVGPSRRQRMLPFDLDGSIVLAWRPIFSKNPTPWINPAESPAFSLGTILHNEVLSFYHWVRPKPFEQVIRNDLISRLQNLFEKRHPGARLCAFGSFASGLYLPTADMDLVLLSPQFNYEGKKTLGQKKKQIHAFSSFIEGLDIAVPGSIETIASARVPIIKFVDRFSGLRVDLSFDSTTGLAANETFQVWKAQFPAMPIIVSIIKQFLLLRGLNEVPSGGLGGFSTICLVTSLLQHLPYGGTEPNLGGLLMDFFDFYGNHFDAASVGIRLEPPDYFYKRAAGIYEVKKTARLAIIDPNNPQNDISGGTREISLIFRCFSQAYQTLKGHIQAAAMCPRGTSYSLLGLVLGGNYAPYDSHRAHLKSLYDGEPRFGQSFHPPE